MHQHSKLRIWYINFPDKALTWNLYTHDIWKGTQYCFFIDGYVQVNHDALDLLEKSLKRSNSFLAATGTPSVGRNADKLRATMLSEGGIHGNLYVLTEYTMNELIKKALDYQVGFTEQTQFWEQH